MKYMVVHAPNADALARHVNYWLSKGWELQGGVSVGSVTDFGYGRLYQALIKED